MSKDYAFPHEDNCFEGKDDAGSHGMTLRDYFAAKAMQGQLSSNLTRLERASPKVLAEKSYLIADAMLEARKS